MWRSTEGSDQAQECKNDGTIPSKEPFDFADLMQDAHTLLKTTDTTMESAGQVADNVNKTLGTFLTPESDGENGAVHLSETMAAAQRAMNNLADDTEAMKHNFLRGFFKKRGFYDLTDLTPEEYRSSKFVKDKSVKRVWLDGQIFYFRPKVRNNCPRRVGLRWTRPWPISFPTCRIAPSWWKDIPSTDHQTSVFGARSNTQLPCSIIWKRVSELASDMVGAIPLGDSPPKSTGKQQWDGVALVLLP